MTDTLADPRLARPWPALWALTLGFFMLMVDSTIVMIAMPELIDGLSTDLNGGMWITSSYLLAYVVPLLITGRLGDVLGIKRVYLFGLGLFTVASIVCGLAPSLAVMVAARVAQGLGAACMSPQTMTAITRMFPGEKRGPAMAVWGATAGVAMLVGPILGGFLTETVGWRWIFFINVPVGVLAFVLVISKVPRFALSGHAMDWVGVALSGTAMFLLVFGIQEGETFGWSALIWALIAGGVVVGVGFIWWQFRNPDEPLIPPVLFADRNFTLSNAAIACMGFTVTGMTLPFILYLQLVRGLDPLRSALMLAPMAVASLVMARPVGRLVGRVDPKWVALAGFIVTGLSQVWLSAWLGVDRPLWMYLIPNLVQGLGAAMVWSPVALSATYNLPPQRAGAGSGVYNATRQVGSVLGSAGIAAVMTARIAAEFGATAKASGARAGTLPAFLHAPYTAAMATSLLLPAAALGVGALIVLAFEPVKRPVG